MTSGIEALPAREQLREQVRLAEDFFGSGQIHVHFARYSLRHIEQEAVRREVALVRIYQCCGERPGKATLEELRPIHIQLVWRIYRDEFERAGEIEVDEMFNSTSMQDMAMPPLVPDSVLRVMMDPDATDDVILYEPARDTALLEFINWYHLIARRTGIAQDKSFGPYLAQLFDPRLTRLLWPSPAEVVAFEFALVRHIARELRTKSFFKIEEDLQREFGFSLTEATAVRRMAVSYIADYGAITTEEARGLLIARLEDLYEEARSQFDAQGALRAAKLEALILGLGKEAPYNQREDFKDLAKSLTVQDDFDQREAKALAPPSADSHNP